jgi:GxxExxY protein
MLENEITKIVIDCAYKIHSTLGPGLLESAYQAILVHELRKRNIEFESEIPMPIHYENINLDVGFRADLIVENKVIIELKSVEKVAEVHKKQLLTYLRISGLHVGLLINFGAPLIREGIIRVVNGFKD